MASEDFELGEQALICQTHTLPPPVFSAVGLRSGLIYYVAHRPPNFLDTVF